MLHLAGPGLADWAKEINADIPILAISGVVPGPNTRHPDSFAQGFLLKPFTVESVLALVHQLLYSTDPVI